MADAKITALTAYTTPIDTDVIPVVDVTSGITKKIAKSDIGKNITKLSFNVSPTVTPATGDLYWNATDQTLSISTDSTNGVSLDLGHELFVRVVNKTGGGTAINDGQVVYISTAQGNRPVATLARADSLSTTQLIGVATQNIADNAEGSVTTVGVVHGYNTTGFAAGDVLYLSAGTAGLITKTAPASPNYLVIVGVALNSTVNGSIYVRPQRAMAMDTLMAANTDTVPPTQKAAKSYIDQRWIDINRQGFTNLTETSISFDGTNTFTLTSVGATWTYYRAGIKYTITGNKTVDLAVTAPATAGHYYIWIDSTTGTLVSGTSAWSLLDTKVTVASIWWNNSLTPKFWLADERHTVLIDQRMQYQIHKIEGVGLVSGGALTGTYTVSTDTNAAKTMGIDETVILDQDLVETLPALAEPDGTATDYVVAYRTGASTWAWKASNMPFIYNAGNTNNRIQWDNAGTMTDSADTTRWYNSYILFNNLDGAARFLVVPGRQSFTSLALAQAESVTSFTWDGLLIDEMVIAYRLTWATRTAGRTSQGQCVLAATPQTLNLKITASAGSGAGTDHNTLANLQGGNGSTEYYHLTSAQTTIATQAATASLDGYATSTQITKLDGIAAGSQVNVLEGVTGTAPIVAGAITAKSQAISIPAATASVNGYATSTQITKLDGIATAATANAKITAATLDTGTDDTGFVTALSISSSHNVPHVVPGTSGNVLKSDGTDWTSAAPSASVSVTTKGDLQTYSTTPDRLPVGATNGHVLTVDSATATGLKWAAAAGGSDATSNVRNEVPGGSINSSNTSFTLANTPLTGSLRVYLNGQRLTVTADYTISGTALSMVIAPVTGDVLLVDYEINSGTYSTGSASWVTREQVNETPNGSTVNFTVDFTPVAGSESVYLDGVLQNAAGNDYTISGATITFVTAPVTGSVILVSYQSVASTAGNADTLDGLHASAILAGSWLVNQVFN